MYNIEIEKVIISRDIKVDEDATWNWVEGKSERRQTVTTHTLPDPEPSQPTDPTNSDSDGESSTNSSESPPKKMRSLARYTTATELWLNLTAMKKHLNMKNGMLPWRRS